MPSNIPPQLQKEMKKTLKAVPQFSFASYMGPDVPYSEETKTAVLVSYYTNKCDLSAVSRELKIPFKQLKHWTLTVPDFARDLSYVEDILHEEAHGLLMRKVLDPNTNYPAWLIFYMKNRDARYQEKAKKRELEITVKDSTFDTSPRQILVSEAKREAIEAATDE